MYSISTEISSRIFLILFAIIGAALTFLYGGNFPFMQGAMPILCAGLLVVSVFLPRPAASRKAISQPITWVLAGVFIPVLLTLAWSVVQVWPLAATSNLVSPYWNLQPTATATISFNPSATLAHLGYAMGLTALAWAVFRAGQSHPRPILVILALLITIVSAYGILIYATGNHSVLWLPKTSYEDSLTATFINRNSFATMAGIGILANLGLMLQRVGEISQRLDTRQRFRAFILLVLRPGWPWLVAALVCFVALVLTNSRAGLTSSLCGIIVLLGSLAGMRPAARWPLIGMVTAVILVSFVVLVAAGDNLGERLGRVNSDATTRASIYSLSTELAGQYPVVGTGLGTFENAFSTVRVTDDIIRLNSRVDHAHNTYLELATELGYPVLALLAISIFTLLVTCLHGLHVRRRAVIWPALGVSTMVLVGIHALFDFSLSIPAVAVATIAILMLAIAQSLPVREQEAPTPRNPIPARIATLVASVIILAFSTWQTAANYHSMVANPTLVRLEANRPVDRISILTAQNHYKTCLKINPHHPTCGFSLAQTYLSLATGYGLTGKYRDIAIGYLAMAQEQYKAALLQAPLNPGAWYRLARSNAYFGDYPAAITALNNSLLTGPAEPLLSYLRIPLMLSLWPYISADDTELYASNMQGLWRKAKWQVAPYIAANPAIQPQFAAVVATEPNIQHDWQRTIKTRYPLAEPLGDTTKTK